MKIKVSVTDKGHTSVMVDGVELNMLAEGFTLSQNAGEIQCLHSEFRLSTEPTLSCRTELLLRTSRSRRNSPLAFSDGAGASKTIRAGKYHLNK